ncbi:hypothetical protein PMIN06_009726 [Paraphaeosphaeria minitans]|uniref:Mitochondrial 2-oxodicarboxylate carrier n=1 Tax=Paraphaeosphaeria minitans TaxID=565426 RepID=A0A9P6GIA4_9PLEO|nr:mitochondrial 2-oxodicarboxylate carrier [Paraphaeosphaeria minitans]
MGDMTSKTVQNEKAKPDKKNVLPFRYQFAAGAVAGISEEGTRLMWSKRGYSCSMALRRTDKGYTGVLDCFKKIVGNEGASRLSAIKFSSNDTFGPFYQRLFHVPALTQPLAVLTGASAGAVESLVVVPFELLKIRLQDKKSASRYNGLVDCFSKVVRQEGVLALYNGFEATLWRHIVWNAG